MAQVQQNRRINLWPASPKDLLPHGLHNSVDGLDLWAAEPDRNAIYLLSWGLVNFYHPFAEAPIRPPGYTFALQRPLKILEATLDSYARRAPAVYVYDYHLEAAVRNIIRFWGMHVMHNPGGSFPNMMATEEDIALPTLTRLSKFTDNVSADSWMEIRTGIGVLTSLTKRPDYRLGNQWVMYSRR
jgi:hypothetical protein